MFRWDDAHSSSDIYKICRRLRESQPDAVKSGLDCLFDQTVVHEITTEMTQSARGYFARLRLTKYVVHCNTPPIYMSVWYLLNPLAVGTQIGHSGWNLLIQMVTIDVV